ncbi:methyltransferase domain-containing protein [Amycolatopsis sp. H20-H5]|uniref:methyltransferase domain-containing protein n=1 Tax=Amycolatopsis sp. H20-H5 TaxID=3046309 RepID=UPI002DB756A1|nr:methyltransferase domain-containing protein [Amycolatopsis sp. H20-H5]MEC3977727.1 methyltransferase domain-containing protein [Amycolatopsis sp. H20-H5]
MGETRPSSAFQTDNIDPTKTAELVAMLDLYAKNTGVQRLREWAHSGLLAGPGERAVDIGAGTGSETHVLATAVRPGGEAIGVEPNDGLRDVATRRSGAARFVHGDALALPFDDGSADVVWCERVFQYLAEPDQAATEIARILRPGGRVALLDTDWGTAILHPGETAVAEAVTRSPLAAAANPRAGRKLSGQLAAAGLQIDDVGSQAIIHDHATLNWPFVTMLAEVAVREGRVSSSQRDRFLADLRTGAEEQTLHMSVTTFAVLAHQPH